MAQTVVDLGWSKNAAQPYYDGTDANSRGGNRGSDSNAIPISGAQLAAGSYHPTITDEFGVAMNGKLVYPRPDSETPAWTGHRLVPVNTKYTIPIGIKDGSWPYAFFSNSMPSGATLGEKLEVSGSLLVPGDDYGVVEWTPTATGTYTFDITCYFQDGSTPVSIIWTVEVAEQSDPRFVWLDASEASSGTGAPDSPLQDINDWFLDDYSDRTFSECQCIYKTGTYNVTTQDVNYTDASDKNILRMFHHNKPLVHRPYNDDAYTWDFTDGHISSGGNGADTDSNGDHHWHDVFIQGVNTTGGKVDDNSRLFHILAYARSTLSYDMSSYTGGSRVTFHDCHFADWDMTGSATSNNSGICFSSSPLEGYCRGLWFVTKCTATNITHTTFGHFNGFYLSNTVNSRYEYCTATGCDFDQGFMLGKAGDARNNYHWIDCSGCDRPYEPVIQGSYDYSIGGGIVWSYCKFKNTEEGVGSFAFKTSLTAGGDYDPDTYPEHRKCFTVRNSFQRAPAAASTVWQSYWDTESHGDVMCGENDFPNTDADPTNTQLDGGWLFYDAANDPFNSDLTLVSPSGTSGPDLLAADLVN